MHPQPGKATTTTRAEQRRVHATASGERRRQLSAWARLLPEAAVLALLLGCAAGSRTVHRYYLIEPATLAPLVQPEAVGEAPRTIEIVAVELPQYLERFQIVSRVAPGRLDFSESHQWADSLRKSLLRTLAVNLGTLLATPDVGTPLSRSAAASDRRVQVTIERFERQPDRTVVLNARWQVLGSRGDVRTYQAELVTPPLAEGAGYDVLVASMSERFGELSRRIAVSLLEPPP